MNTTNKKKIAIIIQLLQKTKQKFIDAFTMILMILLFKMN